MLASGFLRRPLAVNLENPNQVIVLCTDILAYAGASCTLSHASVLNIFNGSFAVANEECSPTPDVEDLKAATQYVLAPTTERADFAQASDVFLHAWSYLSQLR
jgi:hypothetical protein